jgi:hypothetical protein
METSGDKVNVPLFKVWGVTARDIPGDLPQITYYRARGPEGDLEESFKIVTNTHTNFKEK